MPGYTFCTIGSLVSAVEVMIWWLKITLHIIFVYCFTERLIGLNTQEVVKEI